MNESQKEWLKTLGVVILFLAIVVAAVWGIAYGFTSRQDCRNQGGFVGETGNSGFICTFKQDNGDT